MSGLYNVMGQFGGLFNNWQTDQYNRQRALYDNQWKQYSQDMDYWNQMNDYDQDARQFGAWSTGASRMGPIAPRERPDLPGPAPVRPSNFGGGGFGFGGGGGGGWSPTQAPRFQGSGYGAYDGPGYQAQAGFNNQGVNTAGMVDPSAVIASAQPGIMENMHNAFADAGNRFGSSGMVGTPYMDALGTASRGAANDIANITNQYQFQAASDQAAREQERALAEYATDYNSWAQAGDWAHQGQLANMSQGLQAWGQMGDWQNQSNMLQNQLANSQWQNQNQWGFQDYQNQQSQMMQMLPMLMQMMGGY